jgi:hypothetical protein
MSSFHLALPDRIDGKGGSLGGLPLSVELDEVTSDVLDLLFRARFRTFPLPRAEFRQLWLMPFFARVLMQLVKGVDIYVEDILVFKEDFDSLLLFLADGDFVQAGELPDAEVDVDDEVAERKILNLTETESAVSTLPSTGGWTMVPVENLMVRINGQPQWCDLESFME